jgi:hypothetical protein
MIRTNFIPILPLLLCFGTSHAATTCSYDRVEAGTGNTFGYQTSATGLLAVGTHNLIGRNGSAAVGAWNEVGAINGFAVGSSNDVGNYYRNTSNSAAIGQSNFVESDNTLSVGTMNWSYTDSEFGGGADSLLVGAFNLNYGMQSMIAGMNNQIYFIDDGITFRLPVCVTLLGYGLISSHDNCTVVGKNNIPLASSASPADQSPLFIVGNGSSTSARSNALEVLTNGDVDVQGVVTCAPGGDIPMFTGN